MKFYIKKYKLTLILLIMLLLFININFAADIDCDPLEYSLYICKYDEHCRNNFFINYDNDNDNVGINYNTSSIINNNDVSNYDKIVFKVNFDALIKDMEMNDFLKHKSVCNNTDISYMWLKILQNNIICGHNEVYELYLGCVCIEGKICNNIEKDIPYRYQNSHIIVILSLIFGIILFFTTESIKTIFEMENIIKNIYKK